MPRPSSRLSGGVKRRCGSARSYLRQSSALEARVPVAHSRMPASHSRSPVPMCHANVLLRTSRSSEFLNSKLASNYGECSRVALIRRRTIGLVQAGACFQNQVSFASIAKG